MPGTLVSSNTVAQSDLEAIVEKEAEIERLEKEVEEAREVVFETLKRKAKVEPGRLTAFIKVESKRSVSWKNVCVKELGKEMVQEIIDKTPAKMDKKLVITETNEKF